MPTTAALAGNHDDGDLDLASHGSTLSRSHWLGRTWKGRILKVPVPQAPSEAWVRSSAPAVTVTPRRSRQPQPEPEATPRPDPGHQAQGGGGIGTCSGPITISGCNTASSSVVLDARSARVLSMARTSSVVTVG